MLGIAPSIWLWACVALVVIWITLRLDRKRGNQYNFVDILMDPATNKASLSAHIVLWMAIMSIWVVIDRSNDGKDVDTLMATVLGIFVMGRVMGKGIDAWRDKDPPKGP